MKSIKKGLCLSVLLMGGLSVAPVAQARVSMSSMKQSAQSLLDKTKTKAGSTYDNLKSSLKKSSSSVKTLWNDLSPETKAALLGGLATVGAAAAAGTGYAVLGGDSGSAEGPSLDQIWNGMSQNDQAETLDMLNKVTR